MKTVAGVLGGFGAILFLIVMVVDERKQMARQFEQVIHHTIIPNEHLPTIN